MIPIKIAAITLNTTPLDFSGNFARMRDVIHSKEVSSANILVFPELCVSGYGCEDAFYRPAVWEKSLQTLKNILPLSKGKIILFGLPILKDSFLFNCMAVVQNGKILALVPKTNLANTGVHYEKRWFHSEPKFLNDNLHFDGQLIPFGHFVFEYESIKFAIEICEDSWSYTKPSSVYAEKGIDILFSPGASHFAIGKQKTRKTMFQEISRNQNNLVVFTNLCGNESGRLIFEGGALFAELGQVVKEGSRLHFANHMTTVYDFFPTKVKSHKTREFRKSYPDQNTTDIKTIVLAKNTEDRPLVIDKRKEKTPNENQGIILTQFEEFTKAVSLGLFDYLKKSKTKGFTLSLSGGADSATCAILVDVMKRLAKLELGEEIFSQMGIEESLLLVTLYQKTENNSVITEKIAEQLADELSVPFFSISISDIVNSSVKTIEGVLQKNLDWKNHDLVLQNIQARVRSPLIWLLANYYGHLLLSTGNRSEASVGYTTMDGDSSGSICPISGVSKEFILAWIDDIQLGKNRFVKPMESLKTLRTTKPTAELKPLGEHQEDEKDLMPYTILQAIESKIVYHGLSEAEVLENLIFEFPDESKDFLQQCIQKFQKLFNLSQWKRERLPPSFHLDEYGLDPKSSFRFPILSNES
ncbi:NAD(+) synthase [Leptospira sp. 96542]|nr:NAD(+) synthase [Leptospira sp. 96542]